MTKGKPGQVWYDAHLDLLILFFCVDGNGGWLRELEDRKSTRLNSSHTR